MIHYINNLHLEVTQYCILSFLNDSDHVKYARTNKLPNTLTSLTLQECYNYDLDTIPKTVTILIVNDVQIKLKFYIIII